MKNQITNFREFLKSPFPYMSVALCLFLSSTMLTNETFYTTLVDLNAASDLTLPYTLCLVCSDPAAKDVLSDLGFTVANFVLYPVTALVFLFKGIFPFVYASYIALSALYGLVMPFVIFSVYELLDKKLASNPEGSSVYGGQV